MQLIPSDIWEQYSAVLKKRAIPVTRHADYMKWLRYYLAAHALSLYFEILRKIDNKTPLAQINTETPLKATAPSTPMNHNSPYPPLILRGGGEAGGVTIKGESSNNLSRTEAVQRSSSLPYIGDPGQTAILSPSAGKRFNEWRCLAKSASPSWDKIIDTLAAEIKTRHYSRKTLKTYADWSRKFQGFLHNKPPDELSADDIKAYLTYLAVN